MSLFSRSKGPSPTASGRAGVFAESCQRIAEGDFSARIDERSLDGPYAQIAAVVNAALDSAEKRISVLDAGIERATGLVKELADGNFEQRLIGIGGDPVVAPMMHALNDFADVTDAFVREAGASLDAVSGNIYFRKVFTTGLKGEFRRTAEHINHATESMGQKVDAFTTLTENLVDNIRMVAQSITEMNATVSEVSKVAEDASQRSTAVAAAVEETTTSLQSIAAAAEEMLVSVGEINRQVVHSTDITQDAAERTEHSNEVVRTLSGAAANINEVLTLINSIAGQTNLLALNATIEAARAGDAGKGFAVVASEVKSLASQTAKATDEIASQVRAMQDATNATVETIEKHGGTVTQINEISGVIASAVTEQEATTKEISSNIQNAASGSQEVADNMQQVSVGAKKNSEAANVLRMSMAKVEEKSMELVAEATEFLETTKKTGTG